MEAVTFKPYTRDLQPSFVHLMGSMWGYEAYTEDQKVREWLIKLDAHASIFGSTYHETVYVNGAFSGVLFAKVKGEHKRLKSYLHGMVVFWITLRLLTHSKASRRSLLNLKRILNAYNAIFKDQKKHLQNEVTLFLVDATFRGRHLGVKLLDRFETHLKTKGLSTYYLFTDDGCSYTFYDHHGFTRIASQSVVEHLENGPSALTVMLYTQTLTDHPLKKE